MNSKTVTPVTDAEIAERFAKANFGQSRTLGLRAFHRELLAGAVLKTALGYHCGSTITAIMVRMGLTTPKGRVTKRGREFCYREWKINRVADTEA